MASSYVRWANSTKRNWIKSEMPSTSNLNPKKRHFYSHFVAEIGIENAWNIFYSTLNVYPIQKLSWKTDVSDVSGFLGKYGSALSTLLKKAGDRRRVSDYFLLKKNIWPNLTELKIHAQRLNDAKGDPFNFPAQHHEIRETIKFKTTVEAIVRLQLWPVVPKLIRWTDKLTKTNVTKLILLTVMFACGNSPENWLTTDENMFDR